MRTSLRYGESFVDLEIPRAFVSERVAIGARSKHRADAGVTEERITAALAELERSGFFAASRGRGVGLLISDATRSELREPILGPLLERLGDARGVQVLLCTGTHDPRLAGTAELAARVARLAENATCDVEVRVHDARAGDFRAHGTTSRGTPVELSARADACEVFLVVSDLKTHYFAGYSNPLKNYLPGLASLEAVRANHAHALHRDSTCGRHPWHPDPGRRTNPVAEDMLEAFELVVGDRPHFALCTLTDSGGLRWSGGGTTEEVTRRGLLAVDRERFVPVDAQRYLIVSAGGSPLDESLYTAQRALELTRAGRRSGCEVLFLAECANGIGPPSARENFFERLRAPLADVLAGLEREYVLYSHKAWKLAEYLGDVTRLSLVSALEPADVRSIHLEPVAPGDAQAVIDRWLRERGPDDRCLIVDDASKLVLEPRSAGPAGS